MTRFCQHLGFTGFAELRLALATETGRAEHARWEVAPGHELDPSDAIELVLQTLASVDTRLLQDTAESLDAAVVAAAADAIVSAERVLLFGSSSSGLVGQLIGGQLRRIGIPCWAHADAHEGLADAALLGVGDVVVGISNQGRTRDVIEVLAEAASNKATSIVITSSIRSPLANMADHLLVTGSRELALRPLSLSAAHSQLFVLNALFVAVAQRTHERTNTAFRRAVQALDRRRVTRRPG